MQKRFFFQKEKELWLRTIKCTCTRKTSEILLKLQVQSRRSNPPRCNYTLPCFLQGMIFVRILYCIGGYARWLYCFRASDGLTWVMFSVVYPPFFVSPLTQKNRKNTYTWSLIVPQSHTFVNSDYFRLRPDNRKICRYCDDE